MRAAAYTTRQLWRWLRDPLFRHELDRRQGRFWAALLAGLNLLYIGAFLSALLIQPGGRGAPGLPEMSAQFPFSRWLFAGAALLSLCAHWLVPPFLLGILCSDYELRTLVLMVRGRHHEEEVLCGQVAAGVTPLVLGALPLALVPAILALWGPGYLPHAAAALLGAGLWGALCTSVSLWSAARWRTPAFAGAWTYSLTCLALPLAVGLVTLGLAFGCSAGRPTHEHHFVFAVAAGLTWSILVVGLAATFWDATLLRLFPHRRHPLWTGTAVAERLEP